MGFVVDVEGAGEEGAEEGLGETEGGEVRGVCGEEVAEAEELWVGWILLVGSGIELREVESDGDLQSQRLDRVRIPFAKYSLYSLP